MNSTMSPPRLLVTIVLLTLLYIVVGKLGLMLAFVHTSATAVWPPTGLALAALLILGYRIWPAIFLGAFLVNITTEGTVATTLGIATGNTLEGLVGAYLVNRFAHGRDVFDHPQDILKFTLLAGLLSTTISATLGVTGLTLGGFASWARYESIWVTWWLGDAAGALIVTPLVILWSAKPRLRWNRRQVYQAAFLLLFLGLVGLLVFGGLLPSEARNYPLEYLCIPILVWTASHFGRRATATVTFLLSGIAIWGTLVGFGPFVQSEQNESLLLLQVFVSVTAVMALALAATVSERRRTEQKLAQLAAIVESSNDAIIGETLEGTIVSWNAAAERIYGYTAAEVIGRSLSLLVPPDRVDEVPRLLTALKSGERIEHYETVRRNKEGRLIDMSLTISPIKDAAGIIVGASAVARDISDRKEAEKVRRLLAATVESSDDAIIAESLDGIILSWNQGAERIFGYRSEEVLNRPITILVPPDRHEEERQFLGTIKRGECIDQYETVRTRKDGSRFYMSLTVCPIKDDADRVIGASSISRDVTERKRAEEDRNRLIRELSDALERVKTLRGLLPICAACKKIRNDDGYWEQIEAYVKKHSDAEFTHGMCPECLDQFYPGWRRVSDEHTKRP